MKPAPWLRDFLSLSVPPLLSRQDFIARYMPQYVRAYELPTGIRLRPDGHCTMAGPATRKAQVTKRENIITEAYNRYTRDHAAATGLNN